MNAESVSIEETIMALNANNKMLKRITINNPWMKRQGLDAIDARIEKNKDLIRRLQGV